MTDDEAEYLFNLGDSLAEYWSPMDTLAKYLDLGLAKEVKETSKSDHAMPQWKLIAKELKLLKKRAKPFAKETQKLGVSWLRAAKSKSGEIKSYKKPARDYFKKFVKMKTSFDLIQQLVDDMTAELGMEVQGRFQMNKYLKYRRSVITAERRLSKTYAKFLAMRAV
jgi:hypothetical protein